MINFCHCFKPIRSDFATNLEQQQWKTFINRIYFFNFNLPLHCFVKQLPLDTTCQFITTKLNQRCHCLHTLYFAVENEEPNKFSITLILRVVANDRKIKKNEDLHDKITEIF